jgi:hypothetical protein
MTATLPSRHKAPRTIPPQLRRLHAGTIKQRELARAILVRIERAVQRADGPTTAQWCARAADRITLSILPALHGVAADLEWVIREGDAVLPVKIDPRDTRRVRKSKRT